MVSGCWQKKISIFSLVALSGSAWDVWTSHGKALKIIERICNFECRCDRYCHSQYTYGTHCIPRSMTFANFARFAQFACHFSLRSFAHAMGWSFLRSNAELSHQVWAKVRAALREPTQRSQHICCDEHSYDLHTA